MMAWLIDNWRDAILMAVGLLAVYVVFSIMRLVQLSRAAARIDYAALHRADPIAVMPGEPPADGSEPLLAPGPSSPAMEADMPAPVVAPSAGTAPPASTGSRFARFAQWVHAQEPATGSPDALAGAMRRDDFANELRQTQLETEVGYLRRESERLREELAEVHAELALLKSARNVSPLYSEAASLAQKGVPADGIAGQCGISLGEAELVAALATADGRRMEPTEYLDPNDSGTTSGRGNGGQSHRHRRTGTHG